MSNPCPAARAAALLVLLAAAAPAAGADDWKLDVVHLKNGNTLQGLVLKDSAEEVLLRAVSRSPGRPVVTQTVTLPRREVSRLELLPDADRDALAERLKLLAEERQGWAVLLRSIDPARKDERPAFDKFELKPAPWGKGQGLSYQSSHFRLVSNARQDVLCLTAVQLEQIHAAYRRLLPPRVESAQATTVLLPATPADYQALLKEQGRAFVNTAFYDAGRNQIVCPADLQRLADEWAQAFQKNQQLLDKLQDQEADLKKLYKNKVPPDLLQRLRADQDKIKKTNEQNRKECEQVLQRVFQPLYHEAFHAYLANFVYPAAKAEVPRWLNEGLAQVFETAVLEGGELRVELPDKDRLARAQALAKKGELVGLTDLLRSGPKQFLAAHHSDQQNTDRYYVTSWALARHLAFERGLLGTEELNRYVSALARGSDPLEAFRDLVGQPPADYEKDFRQYLSQLQPNGRVVKAPK